MVLVGCFFLTKPDYRVNAMSHKMLDHWTEPLLKLLVWTTHNHLTWKVTILKTSAVNTTQQHFHYRNYSHTSWCRWHQEAFRLLMPSAPSSFTATSTTRSPALVLPLPALLHRCSGRCLASRRSMISSQSALMTWLLLCVHCLIKAVHLIRCQPHGSRQSSTSSHLSLPISV